MTLADIAAWVGAVVLTLGISVIYQRLRPGEMMSREQHLEERARQLTEQVASLQSTINMLSARILECEHKAYPQALRWIAEGRVNVIGEKVLVTGTDKPASILNPVPDAPR